LVMYINPPYAEAGTGLGKQHKQGVSNIHSTTDKYKDKLGKAANEIFAQFLIRIYFEIPHCVIANFSKLKNLQSSNFTSFRKHFKPKLHSLFLTPASTFDNVKGDFPIGFFIWHLSITSEFEVIDADVFDKTGNYFESKRIYSYDDIKLGKINNWLRTFHDKVSKVIGIMHNNKTDFQHNVQVVITSNDNKDHTTPITANNLTQMAIYLSVRKCIQANWLNDRDQFLYPNDLWVNDQDFKNNCLTFAIFNNNIQSKYGANHWIPFTEEEVNARGKFESHFMTDFIKGKIQPEQQDGLFGGEEIKAEPMVFSPDGTSSIRCRS